MPAANQTKILLSVIMIAVSLASCYQPENSTNNGLDAQPDDVVELYDDISLSRYNPPIDITFVRQTGDGLDDLINGLPGETLEDNRWTRLYEDVLGIRIVYDWFARGEQYFNRLGVVLASGKTPDVVQVNAQQLRQLSNAGLIQDLSEAYERYASPLTKQTHRQEGAGALESATINGKLMGIPDTEASIEKAEYIWIRTDWLNRLGLEPPQSMDDLLKIAKAFTVEDPDQNGIADTLGLAVTSYLWDPVMGLTGFMAGFDAYPNMWIKNAEGRLVYGGILPEVKHALKALQEMHQNGYMDYEFAFKNGSKVKQQIADGTIGMMYGQQWGSFIAQTSRENNPDAEWQAFPIVSTTGGEARVPLRFNTGSFFAVRKDYSHPEAIVKLFNLHLEKNWGLTAEYETYYNTTSPVWQLSPVTPFPAMKNLEAFRQIDEARRLGDYSQLKDEARFIQKKIDAYVNDAHDKESGWGWEKIYGPSGAMKVLDQYETNGLLLFDEYVGAPTETMLEKRAILDDLQHNTYLNIILGNSIDEFDRFVQEWLKLGGDVMIAEVNQWHSER